MIAKEIDNRQLKLAISVGFDGDHKVVSLYDPNVPVSSIADVQADILRKLNELDELKIMGVFDKSKLIGYYVCRGGLLISFALSVSFRTRSYLRKFFALINAEFQGCFVCLLWTKNERGIKWLVKNGMQVAARDNNITQLIKG